jgi:deoxyribodipyrimidine photo-lyase
MPTIEAGSKVEESPMERTLIRQLNDADERNGRYVLYWMQHSQRAWQNPALELAINEANERELPVVVTFGLMADYPEANARHYAFLLQGLADVDEGLKQRGIAFVVRLGSPHEVALKLAGDAAIVVCDRGYLRHQKQWRRKFARKASVPVLQVEGDVVIPVDEASSKQEVAARTLRPKIHRLLDRYLVKHEDGEVGKSSRRIGLHSDIDVGKVDKTLRGLGGDGSVLPVRRFRGGTGEARRRLATFLRGGLGRYEAESRDPARGVASTLSPYLHFGQISPLEVARKVRRAKRGSSADRKGFLEELIVRRELAINFVHHCSDYDSFQCLPGWARKTLDEHRGDGRRHVYTRKQLEAAETHDRYWNAAMTEMVITGFMHNYMRMYWGKKILEWTNTPEYGYRTTLYLNNKYFLDGRDANSFANVAWCYGLHDRPWQEREVFGKIRYMNAKGLERKFDMDAYCKRVATLVAAEGA